MSKIAQLTYLPVLLHRIVKLSVHNNNIDSTQHVLVLNHVPLIYSQTAPFITVQHVAWEIILQIGSRNYAQILALQATTVFLVTILVCNIVHLVFMQILFSKNVNLPVFKVVIMVIILQIPAF